MENKVALVTGAAQGIGLSATKALLGSGARVNIVDIDDKKGLKACTELQKEYSTQNVMFTHCDVTKSDELKSAFARTKEEFGGIGIVCNNAGILDEEQWRKMVDINLSAMIEGTYLALEYMSTNNGGNGGVVINTASSAGLQPVSLFPVYCATKHGVVAFTKSLKDRSTSDGVRINALCPDAVDTLLIKNFLDKHNDEKLKAMVYSNMVSVDKVTDGILDIIADTSKSGTALKITKAGLKYV